MSTPAKKLTSATVTISALCGIVTQVHLHATGHRINDFAFDIVAIIACLAGVLIIEKKDTQEWRHYAQVLGLDFLIVFSSVTGYTSAASTFNARPNDEQPVAVKKSSVFSVFYYLLPTQPLFGISKQEYIAVKDSVRFGKRLSQNDTVFKDQANGLLIQMNSIVPDSLKLGFANQIRDLNATDSLRKQQIVAKFTTNIAHNTTQVYADSTQLGDDIQLPARVYIQIADETQNLVAKSLQKYLRTKNFVVPGIEVVGSTKSPNSAEVRYYYDENNSEASDIISAMRLQQFNISKLKEQPVKVNGKGARPRHYEIWFPKNANN